MSITSPNHNTVNVRNKNPNTEHEDDASPGDGVHQVGAAHWRLGGVLDTEWGVRLWAGTTDLRKCLNASESSEMRIAINLCLGSILILMNSISVGDTHRRQQAIDNCHQLLSCPSTNHSDVMKAVLDSGVAPQETMAEFAGIATGAGMVAYSLGRIGAIFVNKYRNF